MHDSKTLSFCGEIIEASTAQFTARCPRHRLHQPPALGAFVRITPPAAASVPAFLPDEDPFADPPAHSQAAFPASTPDGTLFAVVCHAATGSSEPGRRTAAYGLDENDLREQQPQIFDLLCTEFTALPIAYSDAGRLRIGLPPRPPRLHAFAEECEEMEIIALTDAPDFLRALTVSTEAGTDDMISACLRRAYDCRKQDFNYLIRAGKQLALLLHDRPERLAALLRKLEP